MKTRATLSGVAVAALVAAVLAPAPASAHLAGDLQLAKRRVAELEMRITREEATFRSQQSQLKNLSIAVGREQGGLDQVRRDLASTRVDVAETKAELDSLRARIRTRARSVYMQGPIDLVGIVLGAESFGDFLGRVGYAARLARNDSALVLRARATQAKLRNELAAQERLEHVQTTKVASLRSRQNALTDLFVRQQAVMVQLARTRAEALHLVAELQNAIDTGGLLRVAGHGMTISYGAWTNAFLIAIGAPTSRANLVAVVAWEAAEGTMATWNPLATTIYMPGATVYNSSGVKNYLSKEQGIEASILTLRRPGHGYAEIVSSLRRGAEAMDTARAINRSDWCRGCAGGTYVIGFVPAVERYYSRFAG